MVYPIDLESWQMQNIDPGRNWKSHREAFEADETGS